MLLSKLALKRVRKRYRSGVAALRTGAETWRRDMELSLTMLSSGAAETRTAPEEHRWAHPRVSGGRLCGCASTAA